LIQEKALVNSNMFKSAFFIGVKFMDNHLLEPLIKQYLSEMNITKKSYELSITILKQMKLYI